MIVYQVFGFDAAKFFIGQAQHTQAVADAIDSGINPLRIHLAHEFVALDGVIDLR